MAKFGVIKNAQLIVGGVDLSNHVESVTINESAETPAFHAMSDDTAIQTPGLFNWSISANLFQDLAANSVNRVIHALFRSRTVVPVTVKYDASAATSLANPIMSGSCFISSYTPIQGTHGAIAMAAVTFSPSGEMVFLDA